MNNGERVEMTVDARVDCLAPCELFDGFTRDELATLAEAFDAIRYNHEAVTARAAIDLAELTVIVEGGIRVMLGDEDMGVVLPVGHVYGEMGLTYGAASSATLLAEGETTLLQLSERSFHGLFLTVPDLARKLLQRAGQAQIDSLRETNELAIKETAERQRLETEVEMLKERIEEMEADRWGRETP